MSRKIFLEENINLTNFEQLGLGGDWPSAPNLNLQLLEWALSGLLVATFVAVGLVVNTICILFTCKAGVGNSTLVSLLRFQGFVDSSFLVFSFLTFALPVLNSRYKVWLGPHLIPALLPLTAISLTASLYCTAASTCERWLRTSGTCRSNQGALFGYILPFSTFAIIFNLPKFFEFSTESYFSEEDRAHLPYVAPTQYRQSSDYAAVVLGTSLLFTGLLPLTAVIVLTYLSRQIIITAPHESNRRRFLAWPSALLLLLCHLPRIGLNIYEMSLVEPSALPLHLAWLVDLSHLLLALASASNCLTFLAQETSLTKIARELLPLSTVTRLLKSEEEGMVVGNEEDEEEKMEEEESSISI